MSFGRRQFLKASSLLGLAGLRAPVDLYSEEKAESAKRGMPAPKIKDVIVIEAEPARRIELVKIVTDQDGLYGYGDATAGFRDELVKPAVETYLKPLLIGQSADRIEDIWYQCYLSSYYKNDNVLNSALSGVDQALWDIKGRQLGQPVYQLIGGKCREAARVYMHAGYGASPDAMVESAKKLVSQGVQCIHLDMGQGAAAPMVGGGEGFDRDLAMRNMLKNFETFRAGMPAEIGLGCDCHSKLDAQRGVDFCKEAEKFKLYFVEDPLSPEDKDYFKRIREVCTTPIAMGELFNEPHEWQSMIEGRLIDYIRVHIPHCGGFTPGRKIAVLAEQYGIRTAWHAPLDMSPIAHTANLHLDLVSYNFGLQEFMPYPQSFHDIFQGMVEIKDGYLWPNENPGWGIEVDEKAAAKYPFKSGTGNSPGRQRGVSRALDGTPII